MPTFAKKCQILVVQTVQPANNTQGVLTLTPASTHRRVKAGVTVFKGQPPSVHGGVIQVSRSGKTLPHIITHILKPGARSVEPVTHQHLQDKPHDIVRYRCLLALIPVKMVDYTGEAARLLWKTHSQPDKDSIFAQNFLS